MDSAQCIGRGTRPTASLPHAVRPVTGFARTASACAARWNALSLSGGVQQERLSGGGGLGDGGGPTKGRRVTSEVRHANKWVKDFVQVGGLLLSTPAWGLCTRAHFAPPQASLVAQAASLVQRRSHRELTDIVVTHCLSVAEICHRGSRHLRAQELRDALRDFTHAYHVRPWDAWALMQRSWVAFVQANVSSALSDLFFLLQFLPVDSAVQWRESIPHAAVTESAGAACAPTM